MRKATAGILEVKEGGEFAVRRNPTKPTSLIRSKDESQEIKAKSVSVVSEPPTPILLIPLTIYITLLHSVQKDFPLDTKFDDIQQFFDQFGKVCLIAINYYHVIHTLPTV